MPVPAGTILLADDDDDVREVIACALARHGYTVLQARHGREALLLALSARPRPSLILLDLFMRTANDGQRFLAERQSEPELAEIPVVVMSGSTPESAATAPWAASAKVSGWLSKPVRLAGLLSTIAPFFAAVTPAGDAASASGAR